MDLFYRFMKAEDLQFADKSDAMAHPEIYAIASFLISIKFREISCPCLQDLTEITGFQCRIEDIQCAEENILLSVQWELNTITGNYSIPFNHFSTAH